MPEYVQGVELTQDGMRAIFERMGQDITSGIIYNGNPDIRLDKLNQQGFMPILTGVSPTQESGHWIMLIKGQGNQYYLFDPLGESSGRSYQNILARKLPQGTTLSVIPNGAGLNRGLCGYWVASAGVRAHTALTGDNPPTLENLGQTITQEMQNELAGNGYREITSWLRAVTHEFPEGDIQNDATALRHATEKDLVTQIPAPILGGTTAPKEILTNPTASLTEPKSALNSALLESDDDVRGVVDYVHKEYLRHPYPGPLKNPKDPTEGRLPPNEGPDRGTHGLAHTVRTMACAEVMIEEARKAQFRGEKLATAENGQTLADVTPEELKKILIAQAFFVVGRDDERSGPNEERTRNFYNEYHEKSEAAFRRYVEDNKLIGKIFKDPKEVDFYAEIIRDNPHNWDGTPAHILIHQGHMVDLMRVKAPQEVIVEGAYDTLKKVVGSRGAEAVLKTHREFFLATGAVVPQFNPEAINDPSRGGAYEHPNSGAKYVIKEGVVPNFKKDMRGVNREYQLKDNERFVTIKEYYALPEVQQAFPGFKTFLEPSPYMIPTDVARRCEQQPASTLGFIQEARAKVKMQVIKEPFQSSSGKTRRQANVDDVAAARIIQQIMANPDVIQDDHVLLNGQRLEEGFFRDLLAKCDMAIVGSLLNDTDMNNIDRLMQHEKNTEFHSTDPKAPLVKLGDTWENTIRHQSSDPNQIKYDLVYLMQNDAWYYSRVNAIAQNRDKGSTFKEILITSLMTPLTSKALVDTHGKASSPKTLYRGLGFPEDFKNKLISQANTIIANTTTDLFTNRSSEVFMQIKLNDYSKISSKTNASNSTNIEVPRMFGANTIFEIHDPDGLLQAKQVGRHQAGSEDEFSFYLPEDVALIPMKITADGQASVMVDDQVVNQDRHIITFVAIKSPDFFPRNESGFAVEPLLRMHTAQLTAVKNEVEHVSSEPDIPSIFNFQEQVEIVQHSHLSGTYKDFMRQNIAPALEQCLHALLEGKGEDLNNALKAIPEEQQWARFNFEEARQAKIQMDAIKKSVLEKQTLLSLTQCENALAEKNIAATLLALHSIPSDKEMNGVTSISNSLRRQIQNMKQTLTENLELLQRAVATPIITNPEQVRERYEALTNRVTQKITTLENAKYPDAISIKDAIANLNNLQEEIKLLRNEKNRMHQETDKIDFADIEKLEGQVGILNNTLHNAYAAEINKQIGALETERSKKIPDISKMISGLNDQLVEVEQLHQARIKKQGTSKDPLDISDLEGFKDRLQTLNQYLVGVMLNKTRVSIEQMEVQNFHKQENEVQQNLKQIDDLAKTLDNSSAAQKQKDQILQVKQTLIAKQEAYPSMVQLQFSSEALIIQLRELCGIHFDKLAKERSTKTQELTANRWMLQGLTDYFGYTKDERITIAKKGTELDQFKNELNNNGYDAQQLISQLVKRNPSELADLTGLPKEDAEKLHAVLTDLSKNNTSMKQIELCLQKTDEALIDLRKKALESDSAKFVQEEQNNVFRI
ncbi:SidE phosphodiesterase domain-containing protein [Legionella cincinnatiensis]|uniref:Dot/Icm substrate SidE n=1 Tax=Legionella cincinnatiensis TaxID=28085 RepID=A0A378IN35_9GAMM|nr:SidE phosphodiesterase domain-containing protein [Legionella cincinnatiensis]KTC86223.1 Dot/Icm substrate SidE [Legionella cincinnatiensis]STX36453.1 Similar to Sid proteins [Legionella cincinnatiensis]